MEPIRTHAGGLYQIYGRDGDEPWKLAPDKLDTSLSLGVGKIGADKWTPGLRDNADACEAQIAVYAERWANKNDPPKPQILVLGEHDDKGDYTGRYTFTVIDGAMWVAAAKKAGVAHVPVYVVHPTLPLLEREAMWIYFNRITHGLAPTDRQYARILKDLAKCARDRGVTDAVKVTVREHGQDVTKKASAQWVADYARATATPAGVLTELTKGVFATRRSDAEREADIEEFKAEVARRITDGEKLTGIVGHLAKRTGKTKTAIRKWLKSLDKEKAAGIVAWLARKTGKTQPAICGLLKGLGLQIPKLVADAPSATEETEDEVLGHSGGGDEEAADEPEETTDDAKPNGVGNGDIARLLDEAIAALKEVKPAIGKVTDVFERFTGGGDDTEAASLAERREAKARLDDIWTSAVDALAATALRLANQLGVYGDTDRAHRVAADVADVFHLVSETLERNRDPLFHKLNGKMNGQLTGVQMSVLK